MAKNNAKNAERGEMTLSPTIKYVESTGLFVEKGVILGKYKNKYISDASSRNIMIFYPMGYGKGVSTVIPTLLSWEESAVVHDITAENFTLTSGYREKSLGQKIFLWDPANRRGATHCYNPLDYLAEGSLNRIDEIQKISHQLLPENGLHVNEARVLIAVLIESVCLDKTKNNSFGEIYRILSGNDLNNYLESIIARFSDKLGYFCLLNINAFLGKTRENREFIQNLASSALELWADPQIDRTTSSSSFNLANFAREKSTLYVVVHPIDIERLRPLLQIFYQQFISIWVTTNQRSENNSSSRANAMLMILDEFESLGRIKSMESIVFYSRGYRLKICPIVHNIDELENVYGYEGACSLLSGCGTRVACCTNNSNTSALIAELVGSKIIPDDNGSRITVPLLLPQELTRLPKEKVIVASDSVAIECDKSLYYEDPTFRDRLLIATHIPSLEI